MVEGASPLTGVSFSHIYLPIVRSDAERNGNVMDKLCGGKTAIMIIDEENVEGVRNEIIRRLNDMTEGTDYEVDILRLSLCRMSKMCLYPMPVSFRGGRL